jgi:hypothetical protein
MDDLAHHHPDARSVAANRHEELMHHIHSLELDLANARHEIRDLKEEADEFCRWMKLDSEKSAWFYLNQPELQSLVEGTRWIKTFRRAVAWVIGAAAGVVMAAQQLEIWWREHVK